MNSTELRSHAVRAAGARLRESNLSLVFAEKPDGYLADWKHNVIAGVAIDHIEQDLRRGSGCELDDLGLGAAKFCAPHSSAALAVNTFGPFRRAPANLVLAGLCSFDTVEFEYPCPNGLQGTRPHFDVYARTAYSVIGVESKFLEPLDCPPAEFSPQYAAVMNTAEVPWARMYRRLCDDSLTYRHLDAAQLVKHYVGLAHGFPRMNRTLFYLYWEPANAADLAPYRDFRREITDFALAVSGCETRFVAKSYRAQLQEWQHNRAHIDLGAHVERLMQRYDFAI
jgi:hypothetical protein